EAVGEPMPTPGGSIATMLERMPGGLSAGQGRDDWGFRLACILTIDHALTDGEAMPWMRQWDARNAVAKGEPELRRLLGNARRYGEKRKPIYSQKRFIIRKV